MSTWVKICGVTSIADAELATSAGADAVGLNFVPASPRAIDLETGQGIREHLRGQCEVVLVVANQPLDELLALARALEPEWLQLHGAEPASLLRQLLPKAYKAIHVREAADVALAESYPGERILVDAKVPGQLGGTGTAFDYSLTCSLARQRQLILAGGLTPDSVAGAVAEVQPFGVDVASGVERPGAPRHKDPDRVRAFVRAAKG